MPKVLVIQGAGMNMRGKAQIEIFGTDILEQINENIYGYARELGFQVEIFHSNIEGEVANALYDAHEQGFDAAVINPSGYTTAAPLLRTAIAQVAYPVFEVHVTNPTSRGNTSVVLPVCKGSVYGFGSYGYYLALLGIKKLLAQ